MTIVLPGPLALDPSTLAPPHDYDFTNTNDSGKVFIRGNYPYERPCGCKQITLNVAGRFGSNGQWLRHSGTSSNEWPVSYHGTTKNNSMSIAEEGFRLSKCKQYKFGKGLYSTPELEAAKKYATKFEYEGQQYLLLFQNRVNPKYLKIFDKAETKLGTYWLSCKDTIDDVDDNMSDLIRPYGIRIFKA